MLDCYAIEKNFSRLRNLVASGTETQVMDEILTQARRDYGSLNNFVSACVTMVNLCNLIIVYYGSFENFFKKAGEIEPKGGQTIVIDDP